MEGGSRWRLYTYRYTVTTEMVSALRWAAMKAILMFHNCEGQSHKTVHRPQLLKRKESRSGFEPKSLCLQQLRGDKEFPLSDVTSSGGVWRMVPESDARNVALSVRLSHIARLTFRPITHSLQGSLSGPSHTLKGSCFFLLPLAHHTLEGSLSGPSHAPNMDPYRFILQSSVLLLLLLLLLFVVLGVSRFGLVVRH